MPQAELDAMTASQFARMSGLRREGACCTIKGHSFRADPPRAGYARQRVNNPNGTRRRRPNHTMNEQAYAHAQAPPS